MGFASFSRLKLKQTCSLKRDQNMITITATTSGIRTISLMGLFANNEPTKSDGSLVSEI